MVRRALQTFESDFQKFFRDSPDTCPDTPPLKTLTVLRVRGYASYIGTGLKGSPTETRKCDRKIEKTASIKLMKVMSHKLTFLIGNTS